MRALRLIHLAALLSLGVIHRNTPLATLDEYDHINDRDRQSQNQQQHQNIQLALTRLLQRLTNRSRQASHNTGEDQQRYSVTYALSQ